MHATANPVRTVLTASVMSEATTALAPMASLVITVSQSSTPVTVNLASMEVCARARHRLTTRVLVLMATPVTTVNQVSSAPIRALFKSCNVT